MRREIAIVKFWWHFAYMAGMYCCVAHGALGFFGHGTWTATDGVWDFSGACCNRGRVFLGYAVWFVIAATTATTPRTLEALFSRWVVCVVTWTGWWTCTE